MALEDCSFRNQSLSPVGRLNYQKLRQAVKSKDIDLVQQLIRDGAAPLDGYYPVMPYRTLLHLAVISRCLEIVKILLDAGADTCALSGDGETPLTLAAKTGHVQIIDLLLSSDLGVGENKYDGLSHLHVACMRNRPEVVRRLLLLEQGESMNKMVKIDSACWGGFTPLHFAVQYGCTETVKFLLDIGVDITAKNANNVTPLHIAHFHRNEEILDLLLLAHKFEFRNPTDAQGLSHFHIACTRDNASVVEHFLKSGVGINHTCISPNWKGWGPIHFAIYNECPMVIRLLLDSKVYLRDPIFFELLKTACSVNMEIYNLILENRIGHKINAGVFREISFLHLACLANNPQMVHIIGSGKVPVIPELNVRLWTGCTPLHLAIRCQSLAVAESLVYCGADIFAQDSQGKTPLHIAFERGYYNILCKMFGKFADNCQNLMDNQGVSIFHILCTTDGIGLIENFLSRGIDINIQVDSESACWAGFTPLHFAVVHHNQKVLKLLLENHANILITNALNQTPFDLFIKELRTDCSWNDMEPDIQLWKILSLMLTSCSEIKELHSRGFSLLHALHENKDEESMKNFELYLRTHPDEVNKTVELPRFRDFDKCTPLHFAMRRHFFDVAEILLRNGADSSVVNSLGETPLDMAASKSLRWSISGEEIEFLFDLKVPIEKFKPSHFHIACARGCLNVVRHVLNIVTDEKLRMSFLNCRNDAGRTPLHTILQKNYTDNGTGTEIIRLLLENGADVHARDCEQQTPLHLTGPDTTLEAVGRLISHGADINAQNVYGETPLHRLIACTDTRTADIDKPLIDPGLLSLFLENRADVNICDEQGRPWMKFQYNRHDLHCIKLLLKYVKKLMVLEFHVCLQSARAYNLLRRNFSEDINVDAFGDDCRKELELMKLTKVDRYTTLYDILFKPLNAMAAHAENITFRALVESREFCEKYPLYGFMIRSQLKNGRIRRILLEKSKKSLIRLVGRVLPAVCVEAILQCLDEADLKSLISINEE